jgi:RimJ/RimL family protein N-acetyltransferase
MSVTLRSAQVDDIPFILATERLPGYERFTAQWSREEHERAIRSSDAHYLVGVGSEGAPLAFAILQPLHDRHEGTKLKRICVVEPERGHGSRFLQLVMAWVFSKPEHHRLWLDVFTHNARARRVYQRLGFREDGLLRGAYRMPDGSLADRVLMSILRSEFVDP